MNSHTPTSMHMTRPLEWMLSCMLLVWGASMLRPEAYFDMPVYRIMGEVMTETRWGMLAVVVAILRAVGLGINGWWRRTPVIRFVGALMDGLCWLAIGFLMLVGAYAFNTRLPAGFGWYPVCFCFEGWCVLATGYDMFKNGSLSAGAAPRNVT
ncbi:hypothetical protein IPV08_12800 [Methylobacterium sp. SD274]|jgi:hypothetical protein|uniref:hypothetical protein n=1 Tax=Methylobacterium sp. SD274 TaxID=2782009 RepID=UPI001A965965|nr:hypothetical protein [Methylobacterium sp. SD274]MBO1020848.1 hypothetical protein [Methylobacterium sp. SD274]